MAGGSGPQRYLRGLKPDPMPAFRHRPGRPAPPAFVAPKVRLTQALAICGAAEAVPFQSGFQAKPNSRPVRI